MNIFCHVTTVGRRAQSWSRRTRTRWLARVLNAYAEHGPEWYRNSESSWPGPVNDPENACIVWWFVSLFVSFTSGFELATIVSHGLKNDAVWCRYDRRFSQATTHLFLTKFCNKNSPRSFLIWADWAWCICSSSWQSVETRCSHQQRFLAGW